MRVSDLLDAMWGSSPDAEVVVCLGVPDGLGDFLLLDEATECLAEPYPGDDAHFLVHAASALHDIASQMCNPWILRELSDALAREADRMEEEMYECDDEEDIW